MFKIMGPLGAAAILFVSTSQAEAQRIPRGSANRNVPAASVKTLAINGTITALAASAGTLTISPAGTDGSQPMLTVTSGTVITLDGANQSLSALAVGMRANAFYQVNNGVNSALRINASSKTQISGVIKWV